MFIFGELQVHFARNWIIFPAGVDMQSQNNFFVYLHKHIESKENSILATRIVKAKRFFWLLQNFDITFCINSVVQPVAIVDTWLEYNL